MDKVNAAVLPGDVVCDTGAGADLGVGATLRIGVGLRQEQALIVATKAGVLRYREPNKLWVECHQRRYVPAKNDLVIGIISERLGENYRVHLGCHAPAVLPGLAFEGATKKNRPNLAVGAVVYCRLTVANKDMEPEVACTDAHGKAAGMGELAGGYLLECSIGLARRLLAPDAAVLQALGKSFPFEVAVGVNGRVWINSPSSHATIVVANALEASEFMDARQIDAMVKRLVESVAGAS